MKWNWQQPGWPEFQYDTEKIRPLEDRFLTLSGSMMTVLSHLDGDGLSQLRIQLLSEEGISSSSIEGETLDRASVQSSLQRHFNLKPTPSAQGEREQGMANLLIAVYQGYAAPLSNEILCDWHRSLMQGSSNTMIGTYRIGSDPMQIVSGGIYERTVHFEAPPAKQVPEEMDAFLSWFNTSTPNIPALARAAIAHLYFESIHPFEDGNGRIGRAIAEYALSQSINQPVLLSLSRTIEADKKEYYRQLAAASLTLAIDEWIDYFSSIILPAQQDSVAAGSFLLQKVQFFDRFDGALNQRQEKVLLRMFREGHRGFAGGLSAGNYQKIAKATTATTTRDLQDLVRKGALRREGERRHTRYHLNLRP